MSPVDLLNQGRWIEAIFYMFISVMGYWFYFGLWAMCFGGIWLKTRNVALPVVSALICGFAMLATMPSEAQSAAYLLLAIAATGIIYQAITRRGE